MNSNLITKLLVIASVWVVTGCQSESSDLGQGKIDYGTAKVQSEGLKKDVNAKVDILFVIDDSRSMKAHQANLSANINKFVDEFAKSSIIDFHIGIMTTWDSIRYGEYDVENNKVISRTIVPFKNRNGEQQYDELGHLRPVKAPKGMEEALKSQAPNFIVKGPNFREFLKESLNVGIRTFVRESTAKEDATGPENEEFFSPIAAAIRPPISNGPNRGFLRPGEESYLVVVIVTDATDASSISFRQLNRYLKDVKGEDNYSVFGIVNTTPSNKCPLDPAVTGRADAIIDLANVSGGRILNLCSDYATELSEIGKLVRDRTLSEIHVPIPPGALLSADSVVATYGDYTIPQGVFNGWSYNPDSKSIVIRGAADWVAQPGAKISVTFEPVNPTRRSSHMK